MNILEKICRELDCDFGDIVSVEKIRMHNFV